MNNDSCRVGQLTSFSHNPDSVALKSNPPLEVTNKKKMGMHFNFTHQTFNLKKLLGHPGKFIHYVAPLKTFLFLHSYYPKHPYHPGHQARLVWSPWSLRSLFVYTGRQGEGCRRQGPKYTRVFLAQTFI